MSIPTIHPGTILRHEIEARGLSAMRLASDIGVPQSRVAEVLRGRRSVTADTAYRLGLYLGTGGGLWLGLQSQHDLSVLERDHGEDIQNEIRFSPLTKAKEARPMRRN